MKKIIGRRCGMNNDRKAILFQLNRVITAVFYPAFALLLLTVWLTDTPGLLRTVLTCGISFAVLSVFRKWLNAPRPYETDPAIEPPTPNAKKGQSFPSRHVFSAFLIATAMAYFSPLLGLIFLVPAGVLAWLRKELHYHHTRDVIWGAIFALICGLIGFWLIP
jgi:membrane-associated phospholipid phosphatase